MKTLDDPSAISILKTIARARLQPDAPDLDATPELRTMLAAAFGDSAGTAASEGDLARAALDVLAQDQEFARPIEAMARQAPAS